MNGAILKLGLDFRCSVRWDRALRQYGQLSSADISRWRWRRAKIPARNPQLKDLGEAGYSPSEATDSHQRALRLYLAGGDRINLCETLDRLGDTHCAAGHWRRARGAWMQAAAILDELHHPGAENVHAKIRRLVMPAS